MGRAESNGKPERAQETRETMSEPCEHCPVLLARDTGLPREREDATPDGRYFFVRGYPVFDDRGRVSGMVDFSLDITARKKVEESLRESSQFNQRSSRAPGRASSSTTRSSGISSGTPTWRN
jgi:PAS domain-containing protein